MPSVSSAVRNTVPGCAVGVRCHRGGDPVPFGGESRGELGRGRADRERRRFASRRRARRTCATARSGHRSRTPRRAPPTGVRDRCPDLAVAGTTRTSPVSRSGAAARSARPPPSSPRGSPGQWDQDRRRDGAGRRPAYARHRAPHGARDARHSGCREPARAPVLTRLRAGAASVALLLEGPEPLPFSRDVKAPSSAGRSGRSRTRTSRSTTSSCSTPVAARRSRPAAPPPRRRSASRSARGLDGRRSRPSNRYRRRSSRRSGRTSGRSSSPTTRSAARWSSGST